MSIENIFKGLGDSTRIKIIQMLADHGEMCVCLIMAELGMTQPAVSHHLSALKHADLVCARRQGQWVHYSLNTDTLDFVDQTFFKVINDRILVRETKLPNVDVKVSDIK